MGRGDLTVPVVEGWTALAMAAGATSRIEVGSFVLNVMNRHPAVVARMASTLQIASGGRLILGVGIGGHPKEHAAYGIDFPDAPERVARLEEAVAVIRALWTGGPVTRPSPFYPFARPMRIRSRTRRRPSSSAARRRRGRGWPGGSATAGPRSTTTSRPTCRSTWRRSRPAAGDARTSASSSGSRATGCRTRRLDRVALGAGPARDVGALARGRCRRRDRARPDDGRRRRPGGGDRSLVGRRATGPSPLRRLAVSWHHRLVTTPTPAASPGTAPAPSPRPASRS